MPPPIPATPTTPALRELRKLENEKREIIVAFPTLLEAYSLVLFRLGPKVAAGWLSEIAVATMINPTPQDYRQAFAKLQALADQRIALFDATVAVLAERLGMDVWTYDHHFDVMRVGVWR